MSLRAVCNGVDIDAGQLANRGFAYGDGVFRTLLWWRGTAVNWALHLETLERDCAALALEMPDDAVLDAEVRRVTAGCSQAAVKLIVCRRAAARGYRSEGDASDRWVQAGPLPGLTLQTYSQGAICDWAPLQLSVQPRLAGIKHLNRLEQVLASRDWPDGIDERLLCDRDGQVIGGSRTNLFCVRDGRLCTPRLDGAGIAGVMRAKILRCAQALGMAVDVTAIRVPQLLESSEVFLSNALIGIWPVRRLDARQWPVPALLTQRLTAAIDHPFPSSLLDSTVSA